jgi:putative flippase GtrA
MLASLGRQDERFSYPACSMNDSNAAQAQFFRYIVSGLLATAANSAIFGLTRYFLPFSTAVICGSIAGVLTSMALTSKYVFRNGGYIPAGASALRFFIVHGLVVLIILGASEFCLSVMNTYQLLGPWQDAKIAWLKLADAIAFCVGVGLATPIGFLLHRHFTYRAT